MGVSGLDPNMMPPPLSTKTQSKRCPKCDYYPDGHPMCVCEPFKLDKILEKLLEDSHRVPELPFFEFTPNAKADILALIEEVGIKFLTSCGEEDKIEAWKKYLKTGDQS